MSSTTKQEPVTTNYDYPVHPAAEAFPLDITSAKFDALVADIEANGLREPIVLDVQGRLIDGRHRLAACKRLGIELRTATCAGDVVAYVLSANELRRHLSDEQRVAGATMLAATMLAELSRDKSWSSTDKAAAREWVAKLCGVSDMSFTDKAATLGEVAALCGVSDRSLPDKLVTLGEAAKLCGASDMSIAVKVDLR